ncbi:hypothetical protein NFI96_031380 [Prochilodus magdalenae]|nr:hypothetical protein NFI96_031380 [Prochilodus magdalenae]
MLVVIAVFIFKIRGRISPKRFQKKSGSTVKFSLVVPDAAVLGHSGSSVVLPCTVSPSLNCKSFDIHWYGPSNKDNPILLYKDLKVQENTGDPRYRNRVSLIGELEKGNVSLKLENLTLADRGEYVCFVESDQWYEEASVLLSFPVIGELPVLSFTEAGEGMNVTCTSAGWSPKPTLIWRDKEGGQLRNSVDQYRTDWDKMYACKVMILLLLVFDLLSYSNADTFSLVVPDGLIPGQLGSPVVLPCTVYPALDCKRYKVHWHGPKDKDNPILLYEDLKVQENSGDPRYRNRVSLIGELGEGNISLKLENLTLADRGEYVCYVKSDLWYDRASVFLNLPVVGSLPVLSFTEAGKQVNVTCASDGWSPNTTLTWRDEEGRELRNSVDQYNTGFDRLVSVSSWLLFSPSSESEWISCSVGLSDEEMKEGRVLLLSPSNKPDPGTKAGIISLVISLLMMVVMALFIFKIRGRIFPKRSQKESPSTGPLEEEGVRLVAAPETINQGRSPDKKTPVGIQVQSSDSTLGCWFRERIHSGQYYWEVIGLTLLNSAKCPTSWYVGVTNQSAERRTPVPVTPQNGYWVLHCDKDKGYYVNDPSLTPVLVRGRVSTLGVFIDFMILLLLAFDLLSSSNADTFSLVVPDGVVLGHLGSPVVLPCTVSPPLDCKSFEVGWYRSKNKDNPILVYKDLKVQENTGDPRYRNRVSLIGELGKGNVSLKLEQLTLADRGEYVCYVNSDLWYDRASVFLNLLDSEGLVSVSSWLLFSPSGSEWISCSVGLSDQEMKEGRLLPLKPTYKPDSAECTLEPESLKWRGSPTARDMRRVLVTVRDMRRVLVTVRDMRRVLITVRDTRRVLVTVRDTRRVLVTVRDTRRVLVTVRDTRRVLVTVRDMRRVLVTVRDMRRVLVTVRDTRRVLITVRDMRRVLITVRDMRRILVIVRDMRRVLVTVRDMRRVLVIVRDMRRVLVIVRGMRRVLITVRGMRRVLITVRYMRRVLITVRDMRRVLITVRDMRRILITVRDMRRVLITVQYMRRVLITVRDMRRVLITV